MSQRLHNRGPLLKKVCCKHQKENIRKCQSCSKKLLYPMMTHFYPDGCGLFQTDSAPIHRVPGLSEWLDADENDVKHDQWCSGHSNTYGRLGVLDSTVVHHRYNTSREFFFSFSFVHHSSRIYTKVHESSFFLLLITGLACKTSICAGNTQSWQNHCQISNKNEIPVWKDRGIVHAWSRIDFFAHGDWESSALTPNVRYTTINRKARLTDDTIEH